MNAGTSDHTRAARSAPLRILITGGGTGGHIYPGLAVAEALHALDPHLQIRFAGTAAGLEASLVPQAGYRLHLIPASGLRGLHGAARWLFAANFVRGVATGLVLLLRWRPRVILGTGGFASAPVMTAGRLLAVPCALQEQNAMPGSANRLLGRWARRIYLGFEAGRRYFHPDRCVHTGNPVRAAFKVRAVERQGPGRHILIFGGSRGARTLNRAVQEAAAVWGRRSDLSFRIQTGPQEAAEVKAACAAAGGNFQVEPYIQDMAAALTWADLAVCRAGAMTLAEVQCMGKPSVLVPYPHATDQHQLRNAEDCARAGAARVLEDARCDGPTLISAVDALLREPGLLQAMGAAARTLARPQAAEVIALDLLHLCRHPAGRPAAGMTTGTEGA